MSDHPAYLPAGVADTLRMRLAGLSDDHRWKISRLVERAFAEGYETGFMRGYGEGWASGKAAAEAHGDDQ